MLQNLNRKTVELGLTPVHTIPVTCDSLAGSKHPCVLFIGKLIAGCLQYSPDFSILLFTRSFFSAFICTLFTL
jgi:hypothetical protein